MEDTDFHELGRQLLTEFGSMHQRVSRFADKALGGEMAVMRALMLAGGSLTPSELADRAWVSSARIANILRALEAKGWVEREHSKTDRRRVHVTVTDKGFHDLEIKRREFEDRTAAFLEQFGETDTQEGASSKTCQRNYRPQPRKERCRVRILKLFKKHVLALFAAIVLIVISCNADLALPTYMSDIVDVGVQQGGIASPVPDTIRAESLDDLELFMSSKDAKAVEAVFSKADNNGIRTYKGTEEERADGGKIADIMSLPETVVLSFNQGIDANSMGDMMGTSGEKDNSGAQAMPTPEQMAAMTPEQLAEMQQKAAAAASAVLHLLISVF